MKKRLIACAVLLLCGAVPSVWASQTTVTVTGAEQQASNGIFDSGSVTVTVNGYPETVTYGQFSTNASLASGLAAKFSQDCNSPVIAHASGTAITFATRDPAAAVSGITAPILWDNQDFTVASFGVTIPTNTPPVLTPTFVCAPTTIISGENLTCAVTLIVGAQSAVSFSVVNGSAWTTATPDQVTGTATANAIFPQGAGTYTIAYSYPGDSIPNQAPIPAESGTAQVTVEAQGASLPGNQVYAFSIVTNGQNGQPASGSQSGYAANSNIQAYTDSVNGNWTLGYDGLNRLTASTQQPTNASPLYGCWAYDSFGNMLTQAISNRSITSGLTSSPYCQAQSGSTTWQSLASYSAANQATSGQWLDAAKNTHTGSPGYDGAGDITNDLVNTYLYDADGRVCATQGLSGGQPSGAVTGYLYDADGHRVAKTTLSSLTCDPAAIQQVTAEYFIGPDGETMTEVDPTPTGDMWVRTEVSAAGQFLATYKPYGVHYAVTDWLGTKRAQVDPGNTLNADGVDETCTSLAFGDQLNCNTPLDASPRHFTDKERDAESGLDYFGARYYGSSMGRFISPDWSANAEPVPYAKLDDPQTLNLYAYVGNNPLGRADSDGHMGNPMSSYLQRPMTQPSNYLELISESVSDWQEQVNFDLVQAQNGQAQQQSDSTNGGFLHNLGHHLTNLAHLHSWNYRGDSDPSRATMATTDAIGVITTIVHAGPVPYISSVVSIFNDHSTQNIFTNGLSSVPEAGGGMAITGAFNDLFEYGAYHSQPLNNWQNTPYLLDGNGQGGNHEEQPLGPQGGGGNSQPSCELDGNCP